MIVVAECYLDSSTSLQSYCVPKTEDLTTMQISKNIPKKASTKTALQC